MEVWNLDSNLVAPTDDKLTFYADIISDVGDKADKGYPTGIVDYWYVGWLVDRLSLQCHGDRPPSSYPGSPVTNLLRRTDVDQLFAPTGP